MKNLRRALAWAPLVAAMTCGPVTGQPWRPGPSEWVSGSAGASEVLDSVNALEAGLELRFAARRFRLLPRWLPDLIPTAGTMASSKGTLYAYGGFRFELPLGERWVLSPGTAAGLYYRNRGKDLGGPVEFRSHLELAYRLPGSARLGLCFYHLSNAGLFDHNPGTESLVLTWTARLHPSQP